MFSRHVLYIEVYSVLSGTNSSHFSSATLLSSSEMNVKNFMQFIYRSNSFSCLQTLATEWKKHKENISFQLYLNTQKLTNFKNLDC